MEPRHAELDRAPALPESWSAYARLECVQGPTPEELCGDGAYAGRALAVTGVVERWPAFGKWTPEFFRARYGAHVLPVSRTFSGQRARMSVAEYVDYMQAAREDDPWYLRDWAFADRAPELLADYDVPPYGACLLHRTPRTARLRWIYLGAAGTSSTLHQDVAGTSSWNALLWGHKLWLLFRPLPEALVEGGHVYGVGPRARPVPNEAGPIAHVQRPGDLMLIPSAWWHQVYNLTPTIALTHNFVNADNVTVVMRALERYGQTEALERLRTVARAQGLT